VSAPRVGVLGVDVDAVTLDALLDDVEVAVETRTRLVVANHNLHSARLVREDPAMARFYGRAGRIVIDGMPLVWFGRLLGHDLAPAHRITCVDSIPALLERAESRRWRVFVLGSDTVTHTRGIARVRERFPGLDVTGRDGWFDVGSAADDAVVAEVNRARPDVLLVGMGMPRQEPWLDVRLDELDAPVVVTVGGWLDYVAGARATPPRWVARLGFEWLARLVDEPRRLAYRYLVEPWALVPVAAAELWSARVRTR
jgi:N-acetylglucosaminyldiphosphoundecaprenol N-acetyl-beta-D-mannosaminyltransferase